MTETARTAREQAGAVHDVAIVGLGPVGATLAHLLALRGLSVLVLTLGKPDAGPNCPSVPGCAALAGMF